MFFKQTFETNIYMKIFRWLYILLGLNLAFSLVNLLFFLAANFLAIDVGNLWFFWAALLPFGPALIAGLAAADQFKEQRDIEPFKVFVSGLKKFGAAGLAYWGFALLGVLIIAVDVAFFTQQPLGKGVIPLLLVLGSAVIAFSLNMMYFRVRNPQHDVKAVARIAGYYLLRKWYAAALNVLLLGCIPVVMILKPQFGFIVTPSLFLGIIYLNCSQLHKAAAGVTC